MPIRLAWMYTESRLTPWKEIIDGRTVADFVLRAPRSYSSSVTHYHGDSEALREFLLWHQCIVNLCYGYQDQDQVDVAAVLERIPVRTTTPSISAMRCAQDKSTLPRLAKTLGFRTPAIFNSIDEVPKDEMLLIKKQFGAHHRDIRIGHYSELQSALEAIYGQGNPAQEIVQPYIAGREFTVAIVPSSNLRSIECLPPLEIYPDSDRDIYTAGSLFGDTERDYRPHLQEHIHKSLSDIATAAHDAVGLFAISRMDFRFDGQNLYLLDINSMPNLHPLASYLPRICQENGIDNEEFWRRYLGYATTMDKAAGPNFQLT